MKTGISAVLLSLVTAGVLRSAPPDKATPQPKFVETGFAFKFNVYDGNPAKDEPKKFQFQVERLPRSWPTEFLKLGDSVRGTHWMLVKFEHKTRADANNDELDVSELTLTNTITKETIILPFDKVVQVASAPKKP